MHATKLYVTGKQGSGKTSLIKAILNGDSSQSLLSPSRSSGTSSPLSLSTLDSICVYHWELNAESTDDEDTNTLDIWDLPGNQMYQEAHTVCMTSPCLVLLVVDAGSDFSEVSRILPQLQNKCPDSHVIIALTQSDRLNNTDNREVTKKAENLLNMVRDWLDHRKLLIKRHIADIKSVVKEYLETSANKNVKDKPDQRTLIHQLTDQMRHIMKTSFTLHENIFIVSATTGMGLVDLRQTLIEMATDKNKFHHGKDKVTDSTLIPLVLKSLSDHREAGNVLVKWEQFYSWIQKSVTDELQKKESCEALLQLDEVVARLEAWGNLLDIHLHSPVDTLASDWNTINTVSAKIDSDARPDQPKDSASRLPSTNGISQRYICVDPEVFAVMITDLLIIDDKKTFRLDPSKFWPKDSGFKPPDKHCLGRILEAIATKGIIREAVYPLIWQDHDLCQEQIKQALYVFEGLGLLTPQAPIKTDCAGLAMPAYPSLSPVGCHSSVLMDLIPNSRPQLNWTLKPFQGDLQITWRLSTITTISSGGMKRTLAVVRRAFENCCDYSHIWNQGVIIKFAEATLCLDLSSLTLDISCRVNGDEPGQEDTAVKILWVHLIPAIKVVEEFFACHMPGVLFKTSVILYGDVFYNSKKVKNEPELSLIQCLIKWQTGIPMIVKEAEEERKVDLDLTFPFQGDDSKKVWTPDSWKLLVLSKSQQVFQDCSDLSTPSRTQNHPGMFQSHRKSNLRRKTVEVKWKAEIVEVVTEESSTGSVEHVGTGHGKEDTDISKQTQPDVANTDAASTLPLTSNSTSTPTSTTATLSQPSLSVDSTSLQTVSVVSNSESASEIPVSETQPTSTNITAEDWMKEATKIASRFVAVMMASGVAQFVSTYADYGPEGSRMITTAEVTAAQVTADAAMAIHTGELEGAARAVIEAVKAVQSAMPDNAAGKTKAKVSSSKMCSVL